MRVGITGHRGLSGDVAAWVRQRLSDEVAALPRDGLVGVSCLADGPDSWFAQAVLGVGGALEAVVPAAAYREGLPAWHHATYDALLSAAAEVHATGREASDPQAHMAGSELMVERVELLLAVWDGQPARGFGGTADVVAYAERQGVPVRVLWPEGATRD